jgi:hypothetical protein
MKALVFTIVLSIPLYCSAQSSAVPQGIRATQLMQRVGGGLKPSDILFGIPLPPGKVIGDTYLDKQWRQGSIMLYPDDKMVEGYPIRFDIKTNEVEINTSAGVKVIPGTKVHSFVWMDSVRNTPHYYVNARKYTHAEEGVPFVGFFEVLSDGQYPLFKKTRLAIKRSNYNVALNVGSRDDQIIKEEDFYIASGTKVGELPSSKKKLFALFGDKAAEVSAYAKEQSLGISKEDDLAMIFDFVNSQE